MRSAPCRLARLACLGSLPGPHPRFAPVRPRAVRPRLEGARTVTVTQRPIPGSPACLRVPTTLGLAAREERRGQLSPHPPTHWCLAATRDAPRNAAEMVARPNGPDRGWARGERAGCGLLAQPGRESANALVGRGCLRCVCHTLTVHALTHDATSPDN